MYAHQVIEELKDDRLFPKEYVKSVISGITNAQKFHLGLSDDIHEVIKSVPKLFSGEKFLKMPYDECWFDYDQNPESIIDGVATTKEAILIRKIFEDRFKDHLFAGTVVSYFPDYKKWRLSPILYVISINKNFDPSDLTALNEWGIPRKMMSGSGNLMPIGVVDGPPEMLRQEELGARVNLTVAHKALMLLNCKNVVAQTIEPDAKFNKARRKRGKQELFSYKTLHLVLPQDKASSNGGDETMGEHNRIHLCRGHFKEYTEESPLFGKYTGLYWWQPHIRGQNKDGIVLKTYDIHT